MKNWKRRWALFLAAALLALSLTGCGGSGEGPALSVCVGGAPEELDPIYATETADQTVLVHLYENLMRKTGDGSGGTTVTNGAAKSVSTEENADGTVTWTFKLRKAEWSDGRAVRAGDFVFAWQRLADPANDSPSASLLSVVAGYDAVRETGDVSLLQVTAEDDSTLVVVLNGKFDWFLTEVCTAPATMPLRQDLLQEETAAADGETAEAAAEPAEAAEAAPWWNDLTGLVTNGPYQVSGYEAGEALTLEASETYRNSFSGKVRVIRLMRWWKELSSPPLPVLSVKLTTGLFLSPVAPVAKRKSMADWFCCAVASVVAARIPPAALYG